MFSNQQDYYANNPNLRRYVQPDDGLLGANLNGNDWNRPGMDVGVHAFIGKLKDGKIATYQTLPWNHRGWHAGTGSSGKSANNTHISFEICEDGLTDANYFVAVYQEAVELCAFLCKKFGLTEKNIICHNEGAKLGIASNHADVMHWFPKHGESMDSFRAAVKSALAGGAVNAAQGEYTPSSLVLAALDKLKRLGIISATDYWKDHAGDLPYLEDLIVKSAGKASGKTAGAGFTSVSAALSALVSGNVIVSSDYWAKNYEKVQYLDQLIIKLAGAVYASYTRRQNNEIFMACFCD